MSRQKKEVHIPKHCYETCNGKPAKHLVSGKRRGNNGLCSFFVSLIMTVVLLTFREIAVFLMPVVCLSLVLSVIQLSAKRDYFRVFAMVVSSVGAVVWACFSASMILSFLVF